MKNKLLPILLLTLISSSGITSCTKLELVEIDNMVSIIEDEISVDSINIDKIDTITDVYMYTPREFKLYKESVLNQRSGISFTWHDIQPVIWNYMPKMNMNKGFFNAYQAYHDVNSDGYQDILVSYHIDENTVELRWYINSGDNRTFTPTDEFFNKSTIGYSAHKLLKTDVNNDTIADFIALGVDERVQGNYSGNFTVLIGNDDGTYDINEIPNPNKYWFHNGAAADLNGDGNIDVVSATYIWWGDGKGNFTKGIGIDNDNGIRYTQSPLVYEIIDINNDGFNDLILRGPYENTKIILNNNGKFDNSNEIIEVPFAEYRAVMDIEINDIDNDGDWDIIELAQLGGNPPDSQDTKYFVSKLNVYYNDNLNFILDDKILSESFDGNYTQGKEDKYGWSTFKFDDIDGDGQDEILAENYHDSDWNSLKLIEGKWKKTTINFGN